MKILAFLLISGISADPSKVEPALKGTITFKAEEDSFKGATAWVRLWEYDPFLADAPAKMIADVKINKISHTKGKATKKSFKLGEVKNANPRRKHYVTIFVYPTEKVGNRSKAVFFLNGFNKVSLPGRLEATMKKIRR